MNMNLNLNVFGPIDIDNNIGLITLFAIILICSVHSMTQEECLHLK